MLLVLSRAMLFIFFDKMIVLKLTDVFVCALFIEDLLMKEMSRGSLPKSSLPLSIL